MKPMKGRGAPVSDADGRTGSGDRVLRDIPRSPIQSLTGEDHEDVKIV
jgi:hypothetical protein